MAIQTKLDDSDARTWINTALAAGLIKLTGPSSVPNKSVDHAKSDAAYLLALYAQLQTPAAGGHQ